VTLRRSTKQIGAKLVDIIDLCMVKHQGEDDKCSCNEQATKLVEKAVDKERERIARMIEKFPTVKDIRDRIAQKVREYNPR